MKNKTKHSIRLTIAMIIGFVFVVVSKSLSAEDINFYTILRSTGTIKIDGKLSEETWKNAVEVMLKDTLTGNDVSLKSTVKLLWDDTYLYFGFYCEDTDAWSTIEEFDGPLWEEEVVEVFIDPEDKGHSYYELEISPINNIVDLFVINQGKSNNGRYEAWKDWNYKELKSAVFVDGDGKKEGTGDNYWTVEIAIPFKEMWTANMFPPLDGDMWRINCYRIERGDSKKNEDDFFAAFNPTKRGSFHTPWQFGRFYFKK